MKFAIKRALIMTTLALFSAACGNQDGLELEQETATTQQALYPHASRIWASKTIQVCFENAWIDGFDGRADIKATVEDTWEKQLGVDFTFWGLCANKTESVPTLRIKQSCTLSPHVRTLGSALNNMQDGMDLWVCTTNMRVGSKFRFDVAHEFGHALGFAHEQNRPDSPCELEDQGPDGTDLTCPYDPDSIMNYCTTTKAPTQADYECARRFYPRGLSIRSLNYPDHYWTTNYSSAARIGSVSTSSSEQTKLDATWNIVPALVPGADAVCKSRTAYGYYYLGAVSFESRRDFGKYLRHSSFVLYPDYSNGSQVFIEDATFCVVGVSGHPTGRAYESYNYPGRFVRHYSFVLRIDPLPMFPSFPNDWTFSEGPAWHPN